MTTSTTHDDTADDDAWELPGSFTDEAPLRCPRRDCGRFMSTFRDDHGMPVAACSCGTHLGARELIDRGIFKEADPTDGDSP